MGAGLFESRAKAQDAIAAGLVRVDGRVRTKPGERIPPHAHLQAESAHPWASRGGVKLAAALDRFGCHVAGLVCLDIGASTGGFTDVLLAREAARVYAVDVGHDQLHSRLRADPRVVDLSRTDARVLTPALLGGDQPAMIVCDASFISLRLVLPPVLGLAAPAATLLALVKPQFEVGAGRTERGVVRDEALRARAVSEIERLVQDLGWHHLGTVPSPIEGRDGNREFLLGAVRP